jgi:hypothetical protein
MPVHFLTVDYIFIHHRKYIFLYSQSNEFGHGHGAKLEQKAIVTKSRSNVVEKKDNLDDDDDRSLEAVIRSGNNQNDEEIIHNNNNKK